MNLLQYNREAWNAECSAGGIWSIPVDAPAIARARTGDWQVLLTPKRAVPASWLGDIRDRDILCLASAGGQQAPTLAAAGANVVSFDLSEEQLARDRMVARREGLPIACVQGDMADLGCFRDESFDLVFHAASNVFIPRVQPVWDGCFRVLRPGGELLSGFMNPTVFMFDHDQVDATDQLLVRYPLPYADTWSLDPAQLQARIDRREPLQFSHSLNDLIGGQLEAGFLIAGFYEDSWFDDEWLFGRYSPVAMATRARK